MANARAGRGERGGSGVIDAAVVRAALCVRIRTLGESILDIARTAAEEVAAQDREFAEEKAALRSQRRSPLRCSSPPTAASYARSTRTSKAVAASAAAGSARAPTPEPAAAATTVTPRGRSAPRQQGTPNTAKKSKSRRSTTLPPEALAAPAAATGKGKSKQAPPSVKAASATIGGADAAADGNGTHHISAAHTDSATDPQGGRSRARDDVAAVCAAAEANFESVRAKWRKLEGQGSASRGSSTEGCDARATADVDDEAEAEADGSRALRRAPLYDRSNAAISAPHGEPQTAGGGNTGDGLWAPPVVTAGGAESLTARTAAAAPAVPLSADAERQALAELQIVPDQLTSPDRARANTTAAPAKAVPAAAAARPADPLTQDAVVTPLRSYYNVVYIHQSGAARAQPPRGAQQLMQTPTAVHLGGTVARPTEDAGCEAPLLIHSYVSAMYAAERRAGSSAATARTPASLNGDTALVTLDLRIPTSRRPGSIGTPVLASASDTPTFQTAVMTPVSIKLSSGSVDPRDRSQAASAGASAGRAAPEGGRGHSSSDGEVDARIESIEVWQRDRHAHVEDRIRRRRRSSLASGAWHGAYYCSAAATPVLSLSLSSAPRTSSSVPTAVAAAAAMRLQAAVLPSVVAVPNALIPATYASADGDEKAGDHVPQEAAPYYVVDAAVLVDKATTYAVLLRAGSASIPADDAAAAAAAAASTEPSHSLHSAGGAASQSSAATSPAEGSVTPATATLSTGGSPLATAKAAPCPRLEVIVASAYNSVEWAFGGAARRASATAGELGLSPVVCASPLWAAHQRREKEQEEQRRRNARTRQPHGLDICAPISVALGA